MKKSAFYAVLLILAGYVLTRLTLLADYIAVLPGVLTLYFLFHAYKHQQNKGLYLYTIWVFVFYLSFAALLAVPFDVLLDTGSAEVAAALLAGFLCTLPFVWHYFEERSAMYMAAGFSLIASFISTMLVKLLAGPLSVFRDALPINTISVLDVITILIFVLPLTLVLLLFLAHEHKASTDHVLLFFGRTMVLVLGTFILCWIVSGLLLLVL